MMYGEKVPGPEAVKYLAIDKGSDGKLRVRGYATDSADAARHAFRAAAIASLEGVTVYRATWLRSLGAQPKCAQGEVWVHRPNTQTWWVFAVEPYARYVRVIDAKATHFFEDGE